MGTRDERTVTMTEQVEGRRATKRDDVDPLVGAMLGVYRVENVIGRGGMGVVYRARDTTLDRHVAVKTIAMDSAETRTRFAREARAQAKLRHANVVSVHAAGEHAGLSYLVMDLIEGETLAQLVARGPLDEGRALDIADKIATALEAAFARGLVHRDVKPGNVLVEADGTVKLTDFGLARELDAEGPASRAFTPAYAAPEQHRGDVIDHRADMFALGVTLHEMLTGDRASPRAHPLVLRLTAADPEDRFGTYAELRDAIRSARGPRLVLAPLPSRLVAFLVDYFVFGLAASIPTGLGIMLAKALTGGDALRHPISIVSFGFFAAAFGVCDAKWGTTAGKRFLHLRTVRGEAAARPPLAAAVLRSLVRMFPFPMLAILSVPPLTAIPKSVAWLWLLVVGLPALAKTRQALHDRIAGTRVVLALPDETR